MKLIMAAERGRLPDPRPVSGLEEDLAGGQSRLLSQQAGLLAAFSQRQPSLGLGDSCGPGRRHLVSMGAAIFVAEIRGLMHEDSFKNGPSFPWLLAPPLFWLELPFCSGPSRLFATARSHLSPPAQSPLSPPARRPPLSATGPEPPFHSRSELPFCSGPEPPFPSGPEPPFHLPTLPRGPEWLGANEVGGFKLKPIVKYYSKNPRILADFAKSTLPCSEKKEIPFKIVLLIDNAPGHPRALMEMYIRFIIFSYLLTQHSFCSPCIRENTFCKRIAAVGGSSNGSGPSKLKIFWKGFTILDDIKNICDSWEMSKY
ncbi:hypothetical protein QTO34_001106 [Cnephaeus nilssonii]|uniref:DDE-1 domain-containing protein n=1 Tax=Cnephaeus nilssonii TaxID=3371016 RepID=A0AA40HVD0_CNENI|nr:hypothetical protein QTO34_001106 [Eptesicus nilssonii]